MSLLYPLGLIGLIGIPVLILIYIIKNRYTEQIIPSTYIWELSDKFLKRKRPISLIAGIISLILQILIVALLSFAITQPVIVMKDAARSYCFVLDASGSMNVVQSGQTRFDIAKEEINKIIDGAVEGSDYTLIYAGSTTETWFEKVDDKKLAMQLIRDREVGYVTFETDAALAEAKKFYYNNPAVETYLVTDVDYVLHENVNVINVTEQAQKAAKNFALTDITYGLDGGRLVVSGTVKSYVEDDLLEIHLYFDGEEEPSYINLFPANRDGIKFKFTCNGRTGFESMRVQIVNDDDLALDSSVTVFDVNYENMSEVLLVSKTPFFIKAALLSAGVTNIREIKPEEYDGKISCGLYIFDGYMPQVLPSDGTVWFFNPQGSLADTNFSYQNEISAPRGMAEYPSLESSSTRVNQLLTGLTRRAFELKKYIKCGLTRGFTELVTCDGNPLVFVGKTKGGQKEVVFAFDVRDSAQFNLYGDFSLLIKNLVDDCFSPVVRQTAYYSGESMILNNVGSYAGVKVISPSGKVSRMETYQDYCEYTLGEVGVYSVVLVLQDKTERIMNVFAALPEAERDLSATAGVFAIEGEGQGGKLDGRFDPTMYIFIVIVVLAVADFGVYCYEQYQLR